MLCTGAFEMGSGCIKITGVLDDQFVEYGLIELVESDGECVKMRLTPLGNVYFTTSVHDYARSMLVSDNRTVDDDIAFYSELGLITVVRDRFRPTPFGIDKVFFELGFDDGRLEFAKSALLRYPWLGGEPDV